jgi:hypothetical protein
MEHLELLHEAFSADEDIQQAVSRFYSNHISSFSFYPSPTYAQRLLFLQHITNVPSGVSALAVLIAVHTILLSLLLYQDVKRTYFYLVGAEMIGVIIDI